MDVSIIIPTYNRLWCLPKAIESCRNTHLQTEIIVIDDGSSDNTLSWLSSQKDIIIITQANLGKDWAVNSGFEKAKGKYIRFLDSDDWLLSFSTDELFKKAENSNFDIVAAGYQLFSEDEKLVAEKLWIECDDFLAQQLGECDSSHYSAFLFKKDFIEDIPHRQEYGSRDDRKFIIEVALKNPVVGFLKKPTFAHRIHNKARLQTADGLAESYNNLSLLLVFKKTLTLLEKQGRLTERYKKAATNVLWPLSHWVAKKHLADAIKIRDWIYELDPDFQIPDKDVVGQLYTSLGFITTQKLLSVRRFIRSGLSPTL